MPWHVGEYLADTMHLSTLEHGAYLLLLAHGWRNDGMIAASERNLATVTRLPVDQWRAIKPTIERFFTSTDHPTLGPCWFQKRQVEEIRKAKEFHAKALERSKKGNEARWGDRKDPSRNPSGILQGIPQGSTREVKVKDSDSSSPGGDARGGGAFVRNVLAGVDPGNLMPGFPDPGNVAATRATLQAHHDRARVAFDAYPLRSKDGRAIRKDLAGMNLLATRIAAAPDFPWEEAAGLESLNDTPQDLANWVAAQPDPMMLETRRKQKAEPTPAKPGERPRKTLKAL